MTSREQQLPVSKTSEPTSASSYRLGEEKRTSGRVSRDANHNKRLNSRNAIPDYVALKVVLQTVILGGVT